LYAVESIFLVLARLFLAHVAWVCDGAYVSAQNVCVAYLRPYSVLDYEVQIGQF